MSILKKLKFNKGFESTQGTSSDTGEKTFFPETIGIYCVDNPRLDRRQYYPKVIGTPPPQVTKKFVYGDAQFNDQPAWIGRLYSEPVVITTYRYDPYALFQGTEDRIFPYAEKYDKKLPVIPSSGIELPEFYDVLVPFEKRLEELEASIARAKKDFTKKELEKERDEILSKSANPNAFVRITKRIKEEQKVFLPVITSIKKEEEDENGDVKTTFTPKLVIFQVSPGVKQAESLVNNGILENKYDLEALTTYLIGQTDRDDDEVDFDTETVFDYTKKPILLFENKLANGALTVIKYPEDVKKSVAPFFNAELEKPISQETLFRILVLELVGLYPKKDEVGTLEKNLKSYLYKQFSK